jgi:hypothetical protein
MTSTLIEQQARQQISERIARANGPRMPREQTTRRHRVAQQLRRVADRVDN